MDADWLRADAMREFLEEVGRFVPPAPPSDASRLAAFLAEVGRFVSPNHLPAEPPTPEVVDLPAMSSFLEHVARLSRDASVHAAVPDIWGLAGLKRDEQRNSAVLAWVLDPRGSHGLGGSVLAALIGILRARWPSDADDARFPFPKAVRDCRVRLEMNPFGDLARRVDIALDGEDFCVFVEIKVDAPESRDQLASYLALSERRAASSRRPHWGVVFIARGQPKRLSADGERVLLATWRDVAAAIRRVLPRDRPDLSSQMIRQFATHVASL